MFNFAFSNQITWPGGCQTVAGDQALLFARMRYSDPQGDIGRALRQRELIRSVISTAADPSLVVRPAAQVSLVRSATDALVVDDATGIVDLGRLALAFRAANGPGGITGTPPIASLDHRPGSVGSTVLLDPDLTPGFFQQIRDGALPPGPVGGVPLP